MEQKKARCDREMVMFKATNHSCPRQSTALISPHVKMPWVSIQIWSYVPSEQESELNTFQSHRISWWYSDQNQSANQTSLPVAGNEV